MGNEERREGKGLLLSVSHYRQLELKPAGAFRSRQEAHSSLYSHLEGREAVVLCDSCQCLAELLGAGKSLALCITKCTISDI